MELVTWYSQILTIFIPTNDVVGILFIHFCWMVESGGDFFVAESATPHGTPGVPINWAVSWYYILLYILLPVSAISFLV